MLPPKAMKMSLTWTATRGSMLSWPHHSPAIRRGQASPDPRLDNTVELHLVTGGAGLLAPPLLNPHLPWGCMG